MVCHVLQPIFEGESQQDKEQHNSNSLNLSYVFRFSFLFCCNDSQHHSVNSTCHWRSDYTWVMDLPPLPKDSRWGPQKPKLWLWNGSCHFPFNPPGQQKKACLGTYCEWNPWRLFYFQCDSKTTHNTSSSMCRVTICEAAWVNLHKLWTWYLMLEMSWRCSSVVSMSGRTEANHSNFFSPA